MYELLSASFQGVKRFVLAYVIAENAANVEGGIKDNRKYYLSKGKIENYNGLIDCGSSFDQPINDLIKQYHEVRKISTGQVDDYNTGCLLYYTYFKDNYKQIAVDRSKQKALDADPKALQQIVCQGIVGGDDGAKIRLYTILEKSKETVFEFCKFCKCISGWIQ